jgi:RND family efflux transporter MFP subunit
MKRVAIAVVTLSVLAGAAWLVWGRSAETGAAAAGSAAPARPALTVELGSASRGSMSDIVAVVGSLEGQASVEVSSKVTGRLEEVAVRIGDRVTRGSVLARVESRELQEQVRQAEASFDVARATVRQREADLKFAQTNLDRSQSLFQRQLLPRQTLDDADARHQSAQAQLDLAKAQFNQAQARLDELKITLTNTQIVSPVDGFIGKRYLDPGAFASTNAPVASVVDIRIVRMVANLGERDMRRVPVGTAANVEVDAYPGETFKGRVSRVAPVFDPATRTAEIEIEVPNVGYRLKPGMYARVELTISTRNDAITVPRNALVDLGGKTGVFVAAPAETAEGTRGGASGAKVLTAKFLPVEVGIRAGEAIEITTGLDNGVQVITTGASALKNGDRIVAANEASGRGRDGRGTATGAEQGPATGSGRGTQPQGSSR